jgi:flagellar basal-body rod protein FlgB
LKLFDLGICRDRGVVLMKVGSLSDDTMLAMGNYLGRLSRRQQVVASNLANIDTPGYKTQEVSFHATMQELLADSSAPMRMTRPEHQAMTTVRFGANDPPVFEVGGLTQRPDGNNVDLDREMLKLGETSFGYSMIVQLLRIKFRTISSSINEGRMGG